MFKNPYNFITNYFKKTNVYNETLKNYQDLKINNNICSIKIKKEERYIYLDNKFKFKLKPKRQLKSTLLDKKYFTKDILNKGSFSKIYKLFLYKNKKNHVNTNLILKYIDNNINQKDIKKELKTYIFNILLQCYLKDSNDSKYICKIKEYGKIYFNEYLNLNYSFYCIMDNCGQNLNYLFDSKYYYIYQNIHNEKTITLNITKFIIIFIECCNALNILHKLDYVHNDIKPENFLFYKDNKNEIQIKIIDFGGIKKNNIETDDYTYTKLYCDPNILEIIDSNNSKIIINKKFDIFSLGITFLSLILQYFNLGKYAEFTEDNFYTDKKFDKKKYINIFENENNYFISKISIQIFEKIRNKEITKIPDIIISLIHIINLMIDRSPGYKIYQIDEIIIKLKQLFL